jgi:uncharacterized phage protein (TIGR01671 family)
MREILFRGKRVDNGEWVEGSYIKANYHWHNHGIHEDWIATNTIQNGGWCNVRIKYAVIPETVGQYTGLTDKNGNRIFEGDIVECFSSDYVGRPKIDTIKVKDMTDYNTMVYLNCSNELEIIGNIQDSPNFWEEGVDNV